MANETKHLTWLGGTRIDAAAHDLVAAVKDGAPEATGDFNGIRLVATKGLTAQQIVADYHAQLEARAKAYRNSPEGKAAAAQEKSDMRKRQSVCDALMSQLNSLDFQCDVAVLDWLSRFQDPSDDTRIRKDTKKVLRMFKEAGYVSCANCGSEFNENDRDNYARYIVGQGMSCLESMGAIHQMLPVFVERWKAKFGIPA